MHHATAFNASGRFKVTGICDIDPGRLEAAAARLGGPQTGTDASAMARALKPDVFCFCTLPNLRVPMIQAALEGGAKLIAFEKPVALTSRELFSIRDLTGQAGAKVVVSHQHRYGAHGARDHRFSGALGRVHTVYGSATGWMTHMLSHLIDYTCWFNNYAPGVWAMAQASGHGKFTDNHPSPDYIGGFVQFANGVRGIYECGAGAPDQPEVAKWWGKCRMGAQGTEGFAEVLTNGGWRAVTQTGGAQSGPGAMNYDLDMPPYIQDMAAWLDDSARVHPCSLANASLGAEIMFALQRSAGEGGQIALPLTEGQDEQTLLRTMMPRRPALASCEANKKEFGLI